jgi:hypothetical protein
LAEANFVLHAWLRSGNTGAGQEAAQFLSEALSLLGAQHRIRCVRADSGFYADNFLSFLEERQLPLHCRRPLISRVGFTNSTSGRLSMQSTRLVNLPSNFGTGKAPGSLWWCAKKSKAIRGRGQQADRLTRLRIPGLCEKPKRFSLGNLA